MTQRATNQHQPRLAIAMGRRYRGQTQQDLAEALTEWLGEEWSRGMVSHLESGRKDFTVEMLLAIAEIQNLPHSFYLTPPKKGLNEAPIIHVTRPGGVDRPTDNRPPFSKAA